MDTTEFCQTHHITATAAYADSNPHMPDSHNMDHWRVTLRRGRQRLTVPFSMGYGHHGQEPNAADVLDCLASDSAGFTDDFDAWCSEYGYDSDSRKHECVYKACLRQAKQLRRFLGSDDVYDELLYNTERL